MPVLRPTLGIAVGVLCYAIATEFGAREAIAAALCGGVTGSLAYGFGNETKANRRVALAVVVFAVACGVVAWRANWGKSTVVIAASALSCVVCGAMLWRIEQRA